MRFERWKQQLSKLNKTCVMIALVHWIVTFFSDRIIFSYVAFDFQSMINAAKSVIMLGAKAVLLPVLVLFWQLLFWLVKKADRRFVRFFAVYGGINVCLLIATWPGIWRMDEFGILSNALKLQPVFWQNYLTSIFYIYSLMILPIPSAVILMQILIAGLCVAYVMRHAELLYCEKPSRWTCLLMVPFLFLPVLDSNLYSMRMSVYAYLELLTLFVLWEIWKQKKCNQVQEILVVVCGALVTCWRTEAVYYLVALPIIITIIFSKTGKKSYAKRVVVSFLALSICMLGLQMVGNKMTSGDEYDLTSVVLPIVPLVERACEAEDAQSQQLLSEIDRVINVEVAYEGAKEGRSGISLYWGNEKFKRDYTKEDYVAFKKAYYQLIQKYPGTFLRERFTCFLESSALLENTTELFTKEGVPNYEQFQTYPLSGPISDKIRTCVIKTLELRMSDDYGQTGFGYTVVYHALLPMILLMFGAIAFGVLRKPVEALLLLTPLARVAIVFLTAPSRLFMYYYSVYMIGWFVFALLLYAWLMIRREKR